MNSPGPAATKRGGEHIMFEWLIGDRLDLIVLLIRKLVTAGKPQP